MLRHLLLLLLLTVSTASASERTVCDSERGMIFGSADGDAYSGIGANVDVVASTDFSNQSPESIKISHGRFHVFNADDDSTWVYFPYSQLKRYEQKEIAAGRPPIFVTATYQGKKRPVLWAWSLGFVAAGQAPNTPASYWKQAVNLADDRFISFWIHEYAYPKLMGRFIDTPNLWLGCDECAYMYALYGVLDDQGRWVPGIPWDPPFQQDNAQYQESVKTFFRRVHDLAPNLDIMCNDGGIEVNTLTNSLDAFKNIYATSASGLMQEDGMYFYPLTDAWGRGEFQKMIEKYQWLGSTGKVLLERFTFTRDAGYAGRMRIAYATYLMGHGDNFFFAPQFDDTYECPPADYADMRDRLGLPIAAGQSTSASGDGFRLYWRSCQGGLVYLNWTGATRTVALPAGSWYLPGVATPVTTLVLADRDAAYVTSRPGRTAPRPLIGPRLAAPITGPVSVTLSTDAPGATIRYTADGSDPTAASTAYTGPFSLSASAVLTARTFVAGWNPSHANRATYTVTSATPTAQFHLSADRGSEIVTHHFPVVRLDHPSAAIVRIDYAATGGTATGGGIDYALAPGTLTFQPGETARPISIAIVDDALPEAPETVVVTLTNPRGTVLGARTTFTYTIVDDDGGPTVTAPVITSAGTATATVGQPFSYAITATNAAIGFGATGLPAGLSLDATTGVIAGTPAAAGSASVTISATNAGGAGSRTLAITVHPATQATSLRLTALSPVSGRGASAVFTATVTDTAGAADVAVVNLLINDILYSLNACAVTYEAASDSVSLANDDFQTGGTRGAVGSATILRNSQCAIDCAQVRVARTGNDLALTVPIAFAPGFAGAKNIYLRATSAGGIVADNARMGAWTVTAAVDATAPVISAVASVRVTARSATVTWTTDEASDSQVQFGRTASYGSSSPRDATMTTAHSVTLSGLVRRTTYHYRVLSRDAAGNLATSSDGALGARTLDAAARDLTFTTGDDDNDTASRCGVGTGVAAVFLAFFGIRRRDRPATPG